MPYGTGPFGIGRFGIPAADLPAEDPADLSSSRNMDHKSRTYVLDGNGGFASEDDIHQRIALLLDFNTVEPVFIGANFETEIRDSVIDALVSLTSGANPEIEIKSVAVERGPSGNTYRKIVFKKLATNTESVLRV